MSEQLSRQITELTRKVDILTSFMLKDKVNAEWLDEPIAATMCGLSPAYFRRCVKESKGNFSMIN